MYNTTGRHPAMAPQRYGGHGCDTTTAVDGLPAGTHGQCSANVRRQRWHLPPPPASRLPPPTSHACSNGGKRAPGAPGRCGAARGDAGRGPQCGTPHSNVQDVLLPFARSRCGCGCQRTAQVQQGGALRRCRHGYGLAVSSRLCVSVEAGLSPAGRPFSPSISRILTNNTRYLSGAAW